MAKKRASDEDRERAKQLFAMGKSFRDIAAEIDVSAASVSNWARKGDWLRGLLPEDKVTEDQPQIFESANAGPEAMASNTDKLQEAARRRWVDHKAELADKFGERIAELLERAFSPYIVQEVKLVGMGGGVQQPTLTKVELNQPPPQEQVRLLTGLAILVDKASLLSGDATSRVETASLNKAQLVDRLAHIKDEVGAARERAEAARAEAASKGATG